ncbi:MAG: YdcF family protein [Ruminococcus flavefaciens]|nr:YdcF family protein [Ruminococcus flavefaciens]
MIYILAVVFMILFALFLLPMTVGIVNLGNITGAVISGLLTAVCLFRERFGGIVASLWERPFGKAVIAVSGGFSIVCLIIAVVISVFMLREINDRPSGDSTVVVLGCQVKESGPSLMLRRRLDTACDYLSANKGINVIVSGGKGADEPVSEAECMYDYLVSKGISPDRIYIEDKSVNTAENIEFSKKIIEQENLCPDITIITDGYHQLRADIFAKEQGLRAYNIPAPTSWYLVPTYWVREWFGIIYYTVF